MEAKIYFFGGWGGVVGEVGNKANTAQLVVGVKVGAELGNNSISCLNNSISCFQNQFWTCW